MFFEKRHEQVTERVAQETLERSYEQGLEKIKEAGEELLKQMLPNLSQESRGRLADTAWRVALYAARRKADHIMSREEFFALTGNSDEKESNKKNLCFPMTKEEFCALTEAEAEEIERISPPPIYYKESEDFRYVERAEKSQLSEYGYGVSRDNPMTRRQRQKLLEHLIKTNKVSKGYVLSYLENNIRINGKKESNYYANEEWKADLDFVKKTL